MENVPSPRRSVRAESSELEYIDNWTQPPPVAVPSSSSTQRIRSPGKRAIAPGLRSPTKTYSQHSSPLRRAAPARKNGRVDSDELLRSFLAVDQEFKFRSQSVNHGGNARNPAGMDRNRLSVQPGSFCDRSLSPSRNSDRLELPSSDHEGDHPPRFPRPSTASLAPTTVASTRHSLSTTAQSPSVYNKSSSSPLSASPKKRRPLQPKVNRKETAKDKRDKLKARARKVEEAKPLRTDELMGYLPRRTPAATRRHRDSDEEEESSVEESDQFDESIAIRRVARKYKARKKGGTAKRTRKASPESSSPNSEKLRGVQRRLQEYKELEDMPLEEEIVAA